MLLSVLSFLPPFLVLLSTVFQSPGAYELTGGLSAYEEEPSRYTLEYRYEMGQVQWGYDAYIAVADCSLVGHTGTLTYEDGLELSVQVFDCAGTDGVDEDGNALITNAGIVAELDYASWKHYGLGRATVVVRDSR